MNGTSSFLFVGLLRWQLITGCQLSTELAIAGTSPFGCNVYSPFQHFLELKSFFASLQTMLYPKRIGTSMTASGYIMAVAYIFHHTPLSPRVSTF